MRFAVFVTFAFAIPFATSIRVTCTFQHDNFGTWLPNAYICDVQNMSVQSSDVVIEGIDGNHLLGYSNVNVTALRIQSQNCYFVPTGFANFFPNLEGLTIKSARLRSITPADLSQFPNLKMLNLDGNWMIALEEGLFEGVPLLRSASFVNNRLRAIPASLLDPLFFFSDIYLEHNVCVYSEGPVAPSPRLNTKMREVMLHCQNFPVSENIEIETLKKDNEELKKKLHGLQ